MKIMERICHGCEKLRYIWKNTGGKRYCKKCWTKVSIKQKMFRVKLANPISKVVKKKNKKPLPRKSAKQTKLDAVYKVARELYLKDHPMCQVHMTGCRGYSEEIHHSAGRGEYLLDTTTFVAICRPCHIILEENPKLAKALGFSVERLSNTKNENTNEESNQNKKS